MIKKIGLVIMVGFMWFGLSAQSIQKRSSDNVTVEDGRAMFKYNLFIPRYLDTTQANLNRGVDTCYAIIATYDSNKIWYRQCSPKKWVIIGSGSGGGTSATDSAAVLKQVTQIATFSRTDVNQIAVTDTIRGGIFYKYTGSDAADNGMIFSDANGSKWLRQTSGESDIINAQWYGARSHGVSAHDSYADFIAAISYMRQHTKYRTLYIPYDSSGLGYYKVSNTIYVNFIMNIVGDGSLWYPKTHIKFDVHKAGFVFSYPYGSSAISASMENLTISGDYDGTFDVTKHAITTNTFLRIKNVWIPQYDGDGLHISACATPPSGDNNNYGNASHSIIENYIANFCTNGIFVEGCDANIILFNAINCAQNRRWGVYDNGMLGNKYTLPHFAFNGSGTIAGSKSVVSYAGKYYVALVGYDGYPWDAADSNYNKQPDISPLYWREVTAMTTSGAWSPTVRYYSGGTIAIRNANAWAYIDWPYSEAFQPPAQYNTRTKKDGGDDAAGFFGGIGWNYSLSEAQLLTGSLTLPTSSSSPQRYVAINSGFDADAPLVVVNDADKTGSLPALKIETLNRVYTAMILKNASGAGSIVYGPGFFNLNTLSNTIQLGDNGVFPSNTNTIDLGGASNYWKDAYAVTYHGSASQTTLSTTATTDTTTYKPLVVDASGNQRRSSYWYGGGGGSTSPGGNSGNVQINRNGLFTAPGSDSLNFVGGLQIKGTLSVSALANAYGDKQVRWNSSTGSISYIDTLADLAFDNLGTGDTLLTNPSANTIGVKSLIAGTNVTFTVGANSITINSSGLTSSNFVFNEIPTGTIDGSNTTFTIANTPTAGTIQLFLNGLLQRPTTDYTISGTTITMINIPGTGDFMLVHYLK